ncbi:hypothetical protein CANCADRAFT_133455 [Tortispora caseinolytica NRRL Y-17796]|uniref:Apurinic-apyrimidinic endonuclease 1 n=1 Tax=Tortispora caseinolytica NRRL Y-17796 TaxID=767744 RepID=A0A1E4TBF1_9ASCO|nr:hypothetical protein CANCADRAFT_133455 [Tortispora caseinolytica NRRL Y-17796]
MITHAAKAEWFVGAHVGGGLTETISRAQKSGGTAFAIFVKNQRRWTSAPMTADVAQKFRESREKAFPGSCILPHGSYLINLANPDKAKRDQSCDCLIDDLKRCEELEVNLYNLHPGAHMGEPLDEAIARIAKCINKAHKETSNVKVVLENMAGQGSTIGRTLEELRDIISLVEDKSRVGVCIDTCHAFAGGFDLSSIEEQDKFWQAFDTTIGKEYLAGIHLNDSMFPLDSRKDRHENIGKGFIGLDCFHYIMNSPRFHSIPLILETPCDNDKEMDDWIREIEMLKSLTSMDISSKEYIDLKQSLWVQGDKMRKENQAKTDKKAATAKKPTKKRKRSPSED